MKNYNLYLIVLVLALISCKKKENLPDPEPTPVQSYYLPETIQVVYPENNSQNCTITLQYNSARQIQSIQWVYPNQSLNNYTETLAYDNGVLTQISSNGDIYTFEYDALGNLSLIVENSNTNTYVFNSSNNTYSAEISGIDLIFTLDSAKNVTSISNPENTISFDYVYDMQKGIFKDVQVAIALKVRTYFADELLLFGNNSLVSSTFVGIQTVYNVTRNASGYITSMSLTDEGNSAPSVNYSISYTIVH